MEFQFVDFFTYHEIQRMHNGQYIFLPTNFLETYFNKLFSTNNLGAGFLRGLYPVKGIIYYLWEVILIDTLDLDVWGIIGMVFSLTIYLPLFHYY